MSKFLILKTISDEYKEQIIEFWNEYLPGTPPERFAWMKSGNPAGPAVWFLAFDKDSKELAGTISILPKEMVLNHKIERVGILGDYMVSSKYRVFGPALQLLKTATRSLSELNLVFAYTIPNDKSEKIIRYVGFHDKGRIYYFEKPIKLHHFLIKYFSPYFAKIFSTFLEQILKIISRETITSSKGFFEEVSLIDESFDTLCKKIRNKQSGFFANHSGSYLRWRYIQFPNHKFRILTYRKTQTSDLLGYIIFEIKDAKLEVHDIVVLNLIYFDKLLKKLIRIARKADCKAIFITLFANKQWINRTKSFLFTDSKYMMRLFCSADDELDKSDFILFAGDRNI